MKYTVICRKEFEEAKKNPEVIDACLRIELIVPYISSWVDRLAHQLTLFNFPEDPSWLSFMKREVVQVLERHSFYPGQVKRMTAFIKYHPATLGTIGSDPYTMIVEIFGRKNKRIRTIALFFDSAGNYKRLISYITGSKTCRW